MRAVAVVAEADAASRPITVPVAWDDGAAAALAELSPGAGAIDAISAADRWLSRLDFPRAVDAYALLLGQAAAPGAAAWQGGLPAGVWLNLAAFGREGHLDRAAALDAARSVAAWWPGHPELSVALTGLAGLLSACGLDYDSDAAREFSAALIRSLRAALPGTPITVQPPGPIDGLLGVATAGIAPDFDLLDSHGALSRNTRALLAARAMSAEMALAAVLAGQTPFRIAGHDAHARMDAALRPLLDAMPPLPAPLPAPPRESPHRELPARRGGYARTAIVGGQKVILLTGEFEDGRVGDVSIGLPQASPPVRALADAVGQAIGVGLRHGAPLGAFVDALLGVRFAPAGAVEGDPDVLRAHSIVDYVVRGLAAAYLPGLVLPEAEVEVELPAPLPLDLPHGAAPRRRALRVVK